MPLQGDFEAWTGMPAGSMSGWRFKPYEQDGAVRAIAALHGFEIHFAVAPAFRHRVIARHRTRQFLGELLDELGFLTTRAEPDSASHRFLIRLGFEQTAAGDGINHYMLSAAPWARASAPT